jgi:uncharacterized protein
MAPMTKRRNLRVQSGEARRYDGTFAAFMLSLAAAVVWVSAIGIGLKAGSGVSVPLDNITISLSERWREGIARLPQVAVSASTPEWPSWLGGAGADAKPRPAIAIVIDDLGAAEARTRDAIALPDEVTLSFLPYPKATPELSRRAHRAGHEVIVHIPMEPTGHENPGPMALKTNADPYELARTVDWALSRVSYYDGANNHMGSRFTSSYQSLAPVMQVLASRNLFFLDSRTTADTQAETAARDAGMLTGARDVFLDNEDDSNAVERQLARLEKVALRKGSAIAIGHPHHETLAAVQRWSMNVQARGFRLVPLKTVLEMRASKVKPQTVSQIGHPR